MIKAQDVNLHTLRGGYSIDNGIGMKGLMFSSVVISTHIPRYTDTITHRETIICNHIQSNSQTHQLLCNVLRTTDTKTTSLITNYHKFIEIQPSLSIRKLKQCVCCKMIYVGGTYRNIKGNDMVKLWEKHINET